MKNTLKKTLAMGLALVMLVCTCLCGTAFAAVENATTPVADESEVITPRDTALGTVIFSSSQHNGSRLPSSGKDTISFDQKATKAMIRILPYNAGQACKANVTIQALPDGLSKTVTVHYGTPITVDLGGFLLSKNNYEVSYTTQDSLGHIGVTFGR